MRESRPSPPHRDANNNNNSSSNGSACLGSAAHRRDEDRRPRRCPPPRQSAESRVRAPRPQSESFSEFYDVFAVARPWHCRAHATDHKKLIPFRARPGSSSSAFSLSYDVPATAFRHRHGLGHRRGDARAAESTPLSPATQAVQKAQ